MAESTSTTVAMENGDQVVFSNKKKLIKTSTINGTEVDIRLDFRNGKTINYTIPSDMLPRFAAHGAEQKLGDCIAGLDDVEDCVLAVEKLVAQLEKGEWAAKREAGDGMAGTSILVRALAEKTGKAVDVIKTFLAAKSQAQKLALRNDPSVKPIVDRLEAEKAAKKGGADAVDTGALLAELG